MCSFIYCFLLSDSYSSIVTVGFILFEFKFEYLKALTKIHKETSQQRYFVIGKKIANQTAEQIFSGSSYAAFHTRQAWSIIAAKGEPLNSQPGFNLINELLRIFFQHGENA